MPAASDVLVVGAGVSGLTTALCLRHENLSVSVWTDQDPLGTTSVAAGALWGPYQIDDDVAVAWAQETWTTLASLARKPGTGVRMRRGLEAARSQVDPPAWARTMSGSRPATADELPPGFVSGWWYEAPVVDMPVYLTYLRGRLAAAGVPIHLGPPLSLTQALERAPIVVNCTGARAREFAGDPTVVPDRGQVVVVANPGVEEFFAEYEESTEITYILPHGRYVVLGGSTLPNATSRRPDPAVSAAIRQRCAAVDPRLRDAATIEVRVGLRPTRPGVRLQRVATDVGDVVHNYGHGGSGVSLSWACAREVVRLVLAERAASTADPH